MVTGNESRLGGDRSSIARSLAWFVVSLAGVGVVLYLIGIEAVARTLLRADRGALAGLVALTGATVLARGVALGVLLNVLDRPVSVPRAIALYLASTFLNNATPSGQAGGAPASGLLMGRTGDAPAEVGFAAVLVLGVASNLVMVGSGVVGVGVVSATATTSADLGLVATATVALLVAMGAGVVALVRFSESITAAATTFLASLASLGGRLLPWWSPPERAAIAHRVERFVGAFKRLQDASGRQVLTVAVLVSVAHATNIGALWIALVSVGGTVAFPVLLAVVPTATVAAIAPLPSGAGGVAVALGALLVATTTVGAPTIGAAVVLYRGTTHWFRTLVGGVVTAALVSFGGRNY